MLFLFRALLFLLLFLLMPPPTTSFRAILQTQFLINALSRSLSLGFSPPFSFPFSVPLLPLLELLTAKRRIPTETPGRNTLPPYMRNLRHKYSVKQLANTLGTYSVFPGTGGV